MAETYVTIAKRRLEDAGYKVEPADGVPGLWNVVGLARDVTLNQLRELADEHGAVQIYPYRNPISPP